MRIPTQEEVKANIALVDTIDTETLAHTYKVYHCTQNKLLELAVKPLLEAILKELRTRSKPLPELTIGADKPKKEQIEQEE